MTEVPSVPEAELWIAELDYLAGCGTRCRSAQFAIRVAVRAQTLATAAGTDPIDELLDARSRVLRPAARIVLEQAMSYVRADQELGREISATGWCRRIRPSEAQEL